MRGLCCLMDRYQAGCDRDPLLLLPPYQLCHIQQLPAPEADDVIQLLSLHLCQDAAQVAAGALAAELCNHRAGQGLADQLDVARA
jgi:hypothetical protein